MENIKDYLKKFSQKIFSIKEEKDLIINKIKLHTDITLNPDDIEEKNYVLYIKKSPTFLNKIFLSKVKILEDINKNLSKKFIDIR